MVCLVLKVEVEREQLDLDEGAVLLVVHFHEIVDVLELFLFGFYFRLPEVLGALAKHVAVFIVMSQITIEFYFALPEL